MKSEALARFLPEPLPGWTKEAASSEEGAAGGFMGMLGGGTTAGATYSKGTEAFTITLVADLPVVSGIGAMISGMAGIGGKPVRIQRVEFTASENDSPGCGEQPGDGPRHRLGEHPGQDRPARKDGPQGRRASSSPVRFVRFRTNRKRPEKYGIRKEGAPRAAPLA